MPTAVVRQTTPAPTRRPAGTRHDMLAVLSGALLVVAAALVGWWLHAGGIDILLGFPPLLAEWAPHVGPGTLPAVVSAGVVVLAGPALATQLRWRPLLGVAWAAAVAWTLSLALVDGWQAGVVDRLTSTPEYLTDVPRVTDIPAMLATFADHILTDQPGYWTTHVGAHPPGAFLTFVWLDRLGLGGGGPSGTVVVLLGASACVAVAVTLRALGDEDLARRMLPFGVLLPGAVWVGVSADGMFAAVLAWGVALLAVAATGAGPYTVSTTGAGPYTVSATGAGAYTVSATGVGANQVGTTGAGARPDGAAPGRRHRVGADSAAMGGGLLLGWALYLSYGLVLGGLLPLAVLVTTRAWRTFALAAAGVGLVVAAFSVSGFWWVTGYQRVTVIYDLSIAQSRPYWYFVWANLAALVFAIGPAALAGLRRFGASYGRRFAARPEVHGLASGPGARGSVPGSGLRWFAAGPEASRPAPGPAARRLALEFGSRQFATTRDVLPKAAALLVVAALVAIGLADLSGLSKAEVERIWLPFAVWLVVPCALLPRARLWLAAQACLALLINHLLLTTW